MSAPWVGGTVEAVLADLRQSHASTVTSDRPHGDDGLVYAAAIGMISGLARGYTPGRTDVQNLADIRTVVDAVNRFQDEAYRTAMAAAGWECGG